MTTDTLTLAAFIERRLAEDEAVARAATPGPWSAADEHGLLGPDASPAWCVSRMRPSYESMSPTEGYMYDVAETCLGGREPADGPNAAHIARHDPARVLAQVAALRAVVELHYSLTVDAICGTCGELGDVEWPCPTLRAIAAIWADDPEWREEWR